MINLHKLKGILRIRTGRGGCWGVVAILGIAAAAQAAGNAVDIRVLEDTGDRIVLQYELGDYATAHVEIDGRLYTTISLDREPLTLTAGAPDLPRVCRSVVIPGDGDMAVVVRDAVTEKLTDIDIAPSKGILPRTVQPKDVPYAFGETYSQNAFYPAQLATLGAPYILRTQRGVVVEFNPFRYNPQTRVVDVCTRATLEIVRVGQATENILAPGERSTEVSRAFHQIYGSHFINYAPELRYTPLDEQGDMLIIAYDAWIPNVQPLVAHHTGRGINTTVVGVSTIGNNSTAIKSYIQNVYDTSDLAFVLLVGDSAQVATPTASGGSSDPSYAKLAGSDHYPDILVGRFSAETAAHVDTQVERTIAYETTPVYEEPWFRRAAGIASTEGPGDDGENDDEHMDNIRTDLLAYGYSPVDQFYGSSASSSAVAAALNAGRGLINYTGHGSRTAWSTSGFSITNVNALTNVGMLPFIIDVACVNGQFANGDCFAEAWLRATHNGAPAGAAAIYASSVNQSWDPPMAAQDECVDMLVSDSYVSFGALAFAGSCLMMDEYGADGVEMYDTWQVFGDPALPVMLNGPFAPEAADLNLQVERDTPVNITLLGSDKDNDPLDYLITTLPTQGQLTDPQTGGVIMTAPYTLANQGEVVTYTPTPGYIGSDFFLYKVNDGTPPPDGGPSNTAVVQILVAAPPPVITTTDLPDGMMDLDYGPVQLTCADGHPALNWVIVTEANYIEDDLGTCGFVETGIGQDWQFDDGFRVYTLPFTFPFYGRNETEIRIWSNGFIDFGKLEGSSYANSATSLQRNRMVAPLWDDLKTLGGDIFIDDSIADELTVRWMGVTYTGANPVNFSVTLTAKGEIRFNYGAGNAPVTATVGVSAGDQQRYTLSVYDGVASLAFVNSVRIRQPDGLPEGMSLSTAGLFSGTPADAGDFQPVFRVTDSLGRSDEQVLDFHVGVFTPGDGDFNVDGVVDLADFAGFQCCFTGEDAGPARSGCETFFSDPDSDVDMMDFAAFRAIMEE